MNLDLSPKQVELMRWFTTDEQFLFAVGAVRSGKSFSADLGWLIWTQSYFEEPQDFIIAGHSVSSVKRNIIPDMSRLAMSLGMSWKYIHMGSYIQCAHHKYHVFGSADRDSADNVRGMTSAGNYFDEMVLMDEEFINMAITRMSVPGAKTVATMNPSFPSHFVKTKYVDRANEMNGTHIKFGLQDNPNLSPEYKKMLRSTLVGAEYKRLIEGEWVATSGLVYPRYSQPNIIRMSDYRKNVIAIDYSTSGITAMILFQINAHKRLAIAVDEYYHDGSYEGESSQKTDSELVQDLTTFMQKNHLTRANTYILPDPSAASYKRELRLAGFDVRHASNDVLQGIRVTNTALARGLITVSPNCVRLKKELETYLWDERAKDRGEDRPVKTNQHHGVDALRYFAMKEFAWTRYMNQPIAKPAGM